MLKNIVFLFALTIASSAQAYNTYNDYDYTCSEMNQILDEEQLIQVVYHSIFPGKGLHVNSKSQCGICYTSNPSNIKSSNGWCTVGYRCIRDTRITDKENKSHKEKNLANFCRNQWNKGILK